MLVHRLRRRSSIIQSLSELIVSAGSLGTTDNRRLDNGCGNREPREQRDIA